MKLKFLILTISLIMMINPICALDKKIVEKSITYDMSNFIKEDFNEKYGVIRISKEPLWTDINKIAEYSLTKNTEYCLINCEAEGKVTLYSDGVLFDDVKFKTLSGKNTAIKSSEYLIFDGYVDNYVDVPDKYKQVCEIIPADKNGTKEKEVCHDVVDTYKKVNQPVENWYKYNKETLKAGDYRWKIKGIKEVGQSVDFIPIINKVEFNEWAVWNNSLNINITSYYTLNETAGLFFNDSVGKTANKSMLLTNAHLSDGKIGYAYGPSTSSTKGKTNITTRIATVNMWLRKDGTLNDAYHVTSGDTSAWSDGSWGIVGTGTNRWDIYCNVGGVVKVAGIGVGTGWHMLTFTMNATSLYVYFDGNYTASKLGTRALTGYGPLYVGDSVGTSGVGMGIDELSTWDRILSPSEILDLYNGGDGITYITDSEVINIPVNITYPTNTTYTSNVSQLNYTTSGTQNCWYSNSSGFWNSSTVAAGINFTNVISIENSNTWTLYCNDTFNNLNSTSITFFKSTPVPPTPSSNVTAVSVSTCRYKRFGYYNVNLPWIREVGCL